MILDALTAELRDMREGAFVLRTQMREAYRKVKSNPHRAMDLLDQTEMTASAWLDSISRLDRLIRDDLDPLLRRRERLEGADEISDRLAAIEDAIEALQREAGVPPIRAVR